MNQHLQNALFLIEQDKNLSAEEKNTISQNLKDAEKELLLTAFKLDRTEKVKRTTSILLEETIQELEQKRKAVEAQNRKLEIESSLERVRSEAMSMNKPDNLMDICQVVFAELQLLGFHELRNTMINIYEEDKTYFLNYDYAPGSGKTAIRMPYDFHPLIEKQVRETKNAGDALNKFSFTGNELKDFRELRKNNGEQDDPKLEDSSSLHYYFYSIGNGSIGISTYSDVTEDKLDLLKRFRNVFNLAFQRYIDITNAESQAREAKTEAALERVRSRSMAMHSSGELKEVIKVVFEQFVHLNILVEHAGFIMDYKASNDMNIWLADKQSIPFQLTIPYFDSPHWNSFIEAKEKGTNFFTNHLSFEEKNKFYQDLFAFTPGLTDETKEYYFSCPGLAISTILLENIGLYIENFSGIPYTNDENNTLMRFGKVFQQSYTRFLDLQKAEALAVQAESDLLKLKAEKIRTEEALSELKATQAQLIQSEKMASLGELTAGIAHEIQNPLNFINNFSELNKELIDDLKMEIALGNMDEVIAISKNIAENEEKINHHGKRADDIVKGMLQHSRSSSGTKEPTDINKLADEYFRLAYHGLRAKDKTFNAQIKTIFDESIHFINIIPQDIGRVLLNLITNAFYAVTEKKKLFPDGYEPTVTVTTKKESAKYLIIIHDNGMGIPKKILDKIFNPFFTTKPTGKGTGLGLSLSYDIVKAHGGALKVETKEAIGEKPVEQGEGTSFIVELPLE